MHAESKMVGDCAVVDERVDLESPLSEGRDTFSPAPQSGYEAWPN